MKQFLPALLSLLLISQACSKKDDAAEPASPNILLTSGNWQLNESTVNADLLLTYEGVTYPLTGTLPLTEEQLGCQNNFTLQFMEGGSLAVVPTEGSCLAERDVDTEGYTWLMNSEGTVITLGGNFSAEAFGIPEELASLIELQDVNVVKLDGERMVLQKSLNLDLVGFLLAYQYGLEEVPVGGSAELILNFQSVE
jgi:hypothetical protein